ncbi:hypothetical protein THOM_0730 [Trachipleistophora hominis]|uniref:Uncharacterized protein n=1 Tax=Trachipleistophora hominis TaxID=72359 RepID=L7JY98_TRAHO|nr:hypothetical protein THOM_0730 [Trachipleistophora hominis]
MYQPEHVEQVYFSEPPPGYCENMNNAQMYSHYCGKCGNECFANNQPANQHENADCTAEKAEDVPTLTENRQLNGEKLLELVISSLNKSETPVEYVNIYKDLTSTTREFDDNFSNFYIFNYTSLNIVNCVPVALPVDIF